MGMLVPVGIAGGTYPCKPGDIEAQVDKQQEQDSHNTQQVGAHTASLKMPKNSRKTAKYQ
jgi:hypothetical protein